MSHSVYLSQTLISALVGDSSRNMKNIAIVLSGCGHRDGSEISETVSAMISLSQMGAKLHFFAPNMDVAEINHVTTKKNPSQLRNLLFEGARIARGKIQDLKDLKIKDYDGIVFPGGMGAANNLSDWASKGSKANLHPEVARVLCGFHNDSKPIAAICIAPVLTALALGKHHVTITVGNDQEAAQEIEKLGARHVDCPVDDFVTDRDNKVVTTPAYMFGDSTPAQIFKGIAGCIKEFYEMA